MDGELECRDCQYDVSGDAMIFLNYCMECKRAYKPDTSQHKKFQDKYKKKRGRK